MLPKLSGENRALTEKPAECKAEITVDPNLSVIKNGEIRAEINQSGTIAFFKGDTRILYEYNRFYGVPLTRESRCLKVPPREFTGLASDSFRLAVRFERNEGERIYGMGQYQQPHLNLKGCTLDLEQRNSQVAVPFALSSLGYGLLWNLPSTGKVNFGYNLTEWFADETEEMDYWITVGDTPAALVENYTAVVGRAPAMSKDYLGLWQCKLRYRTPEEVLEVAHKYEEQGIHINVIVIDFFHWPYQGSWRFDETYWPEDKVKAMCDELHGMGIKVMVSVWPSVDKRCENYYEMVDKGLLSRSDRGSSETYDYQGECGTIDPFNPETRAYLWEKCKANYKRLGIDLVWLDNSAPDSIIYHFDNIRYYTGRASKVGLEYPKNYLKTFYDGMTADGDKDFVNLVRSAWVGSQKYCGLLWSGDIPSTFEAFRDQVVAGLNVGIAGIPWWTTDIGGFMTDDVNDPYFVELLLRWYEYAVFSPILRMHGDRGPYDIPPLDTRDFGGGYLHTGQPNEIWSYGPEPERIMKKYLDLRLSLADYIEKLYKEASETGAPLLRTMFFEFPEDQKCWELEDQYMFGSEYLVAPVLDADTKSRQVYLPAGKWKDIHTGKEYDGAVTITYDTPIDIIPVFQRA
jgi:alpha-D-xyloside xylohydrolase